MVRTKLRNILNGRVLDNTFRSGEKVERPNLESRDMQFLYHEGEQLVFMDATTYDQMHMDAEATDGKTNYTSRTARNAACCSTTKSRWTSNPASLVLKSPKPNPAPRGDTVRQRDQARPPSKAGVVIQVPIFVNIGDRVKVDTRTNGYLGRE